MVFYFLIFVLILTSTNATSMKKILLISYLVFSAGFLFSQNQTMNWFFGQHAGITFSTAPPTFLSGGQLNTDEGTSSVSDNLGNLLFYSDGINVYDRNHNQMPNGFGLSGNTSTTQCLIVPKPGSSTQYYLFTPPWEFSSDSLRYSIVDITLNGGYGDVSVKNIGLMSNPTEKLAAVLSSNGSDIWLITHMFLNANFYSWLITPSGISTTPVISTTGNIYNGNSGNKVGQLKVSPCGNRLASGVNNDNFLELFNFNNSTGVVSNPILLAIWTNAAAYGVYGVEFSPDGFKLYASTMTPGYILQFNLLAGNASAIIASQDTIAISPNNYNGALQLGLDGKIYLAKNGDSYLACITAPNQLGSACNYIENYVSLGTSTCHLGLPGFFTSWFCEESPKGIAEYNEIPFAIYPNPAGTTLSVISSKSKEITVTNMLGNVLIEKILSSSSNAELDVSSLKPGIYLIKVGTEVKKFMKE